MADGVLEWRDLLELYRRARWIDADTADVEVVDRDVLETLRLVDTSDRAAFESDIALLSPSAELAVGSVVRLRIGTPQWRLGTIVEDWDDLLKSATSRMKERPEYFVKFDGTHGAAEPQTEPMLRYRGMLRFVELVGRSALFVDTTKAKMVFFGDHRVDLPVQYEWRDVMHLDMYEVGRLDAALAGEMHADQRFAILSETIMGLVDGRPLQDRFRHLVRNVDELTQRVVEGYRLFAASFSYSKIRTDVDKAVSEYVTRIHKTFGDIQGQLLGLPVAAVVVATQLKPVRACTLEAFSNVAVLGGALLFCMLLLASCANQWFTLHSIRDEIRDQQRRLSSEFKEIEGLFDPAFGRLRTRIRWQWASLIAIAVVALSSGSFAYHVFMTANGSQALRCVTVGPLSM